MLFKKLFVQQLRQAGLYSKLPAGVLKFDWVVNIKPVGNGEAVLKYLAPYVYRVGICDNRIVAVDEQGVTYRVKPTGKQVYRTRSLEGESFVRAFAQHILPPGFQKVRHYGFLSPNCKLQLADVRWLVWLWWGWTYWLNSVLLPPPAPRPREHPACPHCGHQLELLAMTNSDGKVIRGSKRRSRGPPHQTCAAQQEGGQPHA